jgi:hypothetical protein
MKLVHYRIRALWKDACLLGVFSMYSVAWAIPLSLNDFTLDNFNADGSVETPSIFSPGDTSSFDLTGGNNGSGLGGRTEFLWAAPATGSLLFMWSYTSCQPLDLPAECDAPGYDWSGYVLNYTFPNLTDTDTGGLAYSASFQVQSGESFGWYVGTADNLGGPGTLSVFAIDFEPASGSNHVSNNPEPGTMLLGVTGTAIVAAFSRKRCVRAQKRGNV